MLRRKNDLLSKLKTDASIINFRQSLGGDAEEVKKERKKISRPVGRMRKNGLLYPGGYQCQLS